MTTLLQNPTHAQVSGGTTVQKTFSGNCTSGSWLVALVTKEDPTGTIAVADPTNGSWTQNQLSQGAGAPGGLGGGSTAIFSKRNAGTTALTVTATFNASSHGTLKVYEVDDPTAALSYHIGGSANGTTSSQPTVSYVTTVANGLGVAAGLYYPPPVTPDSGYTSAFNEVGLNNCYHYAEHDLDIDAAATETITLGLPSNTQGWTLVAGAFTAAAAAGGFFARHYYEMIGH